MKKKLEAELISIAHRILKLKNKSDVVQLHQETQKLYEKLSVLRFVEENFGEIKPTIGKAEIEEKLESGFDTLPQEELQLPSEELPDTSAGFAPIVVFMPEEVSEDRGTEDEEIETADVLSQEEEPEIEEPEIEKEDIPEVETPNEIEIAEEEETEEEGNLTQPETDDENVIKHVLPMEEIDDDSSDEPVEEEQNAPKEIISLEDLLGHNYSEPVFERVSDLKSNTVETPVFENDSAEPPTEKFMGNNPIFGDEEHKEDLSHESHAKPITFGLNGEIGFEKHLFGGSSEEMNRVVSQLSTFNTFEEAKDFIDDMVKPDYNNWEGKEDYEQRFMEIIERRFA